MTGATLMFGIGATKAGTTWLHRYLASHPECAMPAIKELHYFNSLTDTAKARRLGVLAGQRAKVAARLNTGSLEQASRRAERVVALDQLISLLSAPGDPAANYLTYMGDQAGEARLVGDITPAYSLLPADDLAKMAALTPVTRFVYILRDPVDRLWSNMRMVAARQSNTESQTGAMARRLFDKVIAGKNPQAFSRSDYASALTRIEAAVPDAQRLTLFFENLFKVETVRQICRFLGLSYVTAQTQHSVHAGPALMLGNEQRAAAQAFLAPQYAAVAQRFQTLPDRWHENMVKV